MLFALGHIDICNTDDADYSLIKNYHYYKKNLLGELLRECTEQ